MGKWHSWLGILSSQVLNVENNLLKALPEGIGDLRFLQTLNVKGEGSDCWLGVQYPGYTQAWKPFWVNFCRKHSSELF